MINIKSQQNYLIQTSPINFPWQHKLVLTPPTVEGAPASMGVGGTLMALVELKAG